MALLDLSPKGAGLAKALPVIARPFFSCLRPMTSAILPPTMVRYSIAAIMLVVLLLLGGPPGVCGDVGSEDQTQNGCAIAGADADSEGELPDNPLLGGTIETGSPDMESKGEAPLLPDQEGLTEEARGKFEALRDALHREAEQDDFDIPVVLNDAVDRHIRCFTGPKRAIFARWLKRSERYAPTIKSILKKNGLPEDLVYLSMIESGFNMKACSRARASGPWQFINETGRRYGLRVDYWVDERYDLEKSTVAAARYLKTLFDRFGCWYLVAASYNAGENRVKRAIKKEETKDFWKLRAYKTLPKETQEYVPQLIAAALIAKDPEKYGFMDLESAPIYRLTRIAVPGGVPLKTIAHALSLDLAELRALNPEILTGITPPDRKEYQIKLPGTPELDVVSKKLEADLMNGKKVVGVVKVCMTKRDSLSRVLKRYDISRSDLGLVNRDAQRQQTARVVYVPRFASGKKDETTSGEEESPIMLPQGRQGPAALDQASGPSQDGDGVIALRGPKKGHSSPSAKLALAAQTVKKSARRRMARPGKLASHRHHHHRKS